MIFKCFLCSREIPILDCKNHFYNVHKVAIKRNDSNVLLICVNNDCNTNCTSLRSFVAHVKREHYGLSSNDILPIPENSFIVHDSSIEIEEPIRISSPCDNNLHIKNTVQNLICQLRSKCSTNESDFKNTIEFFSTLTVSILEHFNISHNDISFVKELIDKSKTFRHQELILSTSIPYIYSKTILLGYRSETRNRNGYNILKTVKDTYQYISILDTISAIYSNKNLFELIQNEQSFIKPKNPKLIASFCHTNTYKQSQFFKKFPNALRINLYYDDIEVANPIGPKSGFHKLGMFYFTIQNFPPLFHTTLDNIFTVLICHSLDIKRYGFAKILQPLIKDLKLLESENGFSLSVNGNLMTIRGILVCLIGDTLAIHEIFELLSPSCNYFCRQCLCTRQKLRDGTFYNCILRTKMHHNEQLHQIERGIILPADCGVNSDSVLNKLKYFHTTENWSFDIMHDLLEGVIGMSIKWVINYYVLANKFTVSQLNQRIHSFKYGAVEYKNKPSPNFTRKLIINKSNYLKQKAVQSWLLLRALPFLIGHFVEKENQHMRLLIILSKIVQICFSLEISEQMLIELQFFIKNFNSLFKLLFPEVTPINKMHHMTHYVESIKAKGPLSNYNCLKYEAKHLKSKKQIIISQNFINIPLSLAKRICFQQSLTIANQHYDKLNINIHNSKLLRCCECLAEENIEKLIESTLNYVEKIFNIEINGIFYKINYFIVLNNESIYPEFIQIREILKVNSKFYIYGLKYEANLFSEYLNAFEIEKTEYYEFIIIDENISKPYNIWNAYDEREKNYISLKEYYL